MLKLWKAQAKKLELNSGTIAEKTAQRFLQQQGLTTLTTNFSGKMGEIDLIMQEHSSLVFVEVRYRKRLDYGSPLETVDQRKQQKLIKTAQYFLQQHPTYNQQPCRFDVIGLCGPLGSLNSIQPLWIKDAFSC